MVSHPSGPSPSVDDGCFSASSTRYQGTDHVEVPLVHEVVEGRRVGSELPQHLNLVLEERIVRPVLEAGDELPKALQHGLPPHQPHEHPGHPGTLPVGDRSVCRATPIHLHQGSFVVGPSLPRIIGLHPFGEFPSGRLALDLLEQEEGGEGRHTLGQDVRARPLSRAAGFAHHWCAASWAVTTKTALASTVVLVRNPMVSEKVMLVAKPWA